MELNQLKEIASQLKVNHHHMIGADRLEAQLQEHCKSVYKKTLEEVAALLATNSLEIKEEEEVKEEVKVTKSKKRDLSNLSFEALEKEATAKKTKSTAKEALRLVRCIITCNNTNKSSYTGEIFSARNASIPEVKKFIPFGTITHVPKILLNMIKEKKYQTFIKRKNNSGNVITKVHMIPEYNVEILPPISSQEFEAIKQKQLAEGLGND